MRATSNWYRLGVLLLVVVCAVGWLRRSSAQLRSSPSYDYKLVSTASADLEKLLNAEGAAGWKVVAANAQFFVLEHVR